MIRLALALALTAASPAASDTGPGGVTATEIVQAARLIGEAAPEDPSLVRAAVSGTPYRIDLLDCSASGCSAMVLSARFPIAIDPDEIADWNQERRFLTAWSEDGGVAVRFPVILKGGMTQDTLSAVFETWRGGLERFRDHIDWEAQ